MYAIKKSFKMAKKNLNPAYKAIFGYETAKKITASIQRILRSTKKNCSDNCIEIFKDIVIKLNVLSAKLEPVKHLSVAVRVRRLLELAVSLLPKGVGVQLELFDIERYEIKRTNKLVFKCFTKWLKERAKSACNGFGNIFVELPSFQPSLDLAIRLN